MAWWKKNGFGRFATNPLKPAQNGTLRALLARYIHDGVTAKSRTAKHTCPTTTCWPDRIT